MDFKMDYCLILKCDEKCNHSFILIVLVFKAWIKRGWKSMRVGRREFAWVFPQLSLLGQTSSESCMRVDESLFSISLFLLVASTLLFLRLWTLVKLLTVRVITIIFSLFLPLLMGNDLEIACFCNSHDWSNEPNLSLTLIKIWTSSKLMRVHDLC